LYDRPLAVGGLACASHTLVTETERKIETRRKLKIAVLQEAIVKSRMVMASDVARHL